MNELHREPLADGRALVLSTEGETAELALLDGAGATLFALPFPASPDALRAALRVVIRHARQDLESSDRDARAALAARLVAVNEAAWEAFPAEDAWDYRTEILSPWPDLDRLTLDAGAAQVSYLERRLAAALRGIPLDAVPPDAHHAPPDTFERSLRAKAAA